jgi:hypothetical protein
MTLPARCLAPAAPSLSTGAASRGRRVGVEIEFLGPSAREAAAALARDFGGSILREDAHAFSLRGGRLGDLAVELDLRLLHPGRRPASGWRLPGRAAALAGDLVSPVVPRELITAPIAFADLPTIDALVESLRSAGAYGSGAVLLDSLGLHFNVDPPDLDVRTLTGFLKAFLILGDRLRRETALNRRRLRLVLPQDYPSGYKARVLDPAYWPDLATFTDDYLAANPTRKRALDLLPVLAHLDGDRVRCVLPREKIAPRPVFHYRLPCAHVGRPGWSIMPDWRRWLDVEELAAADAIVSASAAGRHGTGTAA